MSGTSYHRSHRRSAPCGYRPIPPSTFCTVPSGSPDNSAICAYEYPSSLFLSCISLIVIDTQLLSALYIKHSPIRPAPGNILLYIHIITYIYPKFNHFIFYLRCVISIKRILDMTSAASEDTGNAYQTPSIPYRPLSTATAGTKQSTCPQRDRIT